MVYQYFKMRSQAVLSHSGGPLPMKIDKAHTPLSRLVRVWALLIYSSLSTEL